MQENLAEAERRIEEARRTQAENLDLGDLALSELPASLGDLPHLKALYLGKEKPTEEGDPWDYQRETPKFTDLSPLAGLRGLEALDLSGCTGVKDLSTLTGLQGLQGLSLSRTGVTDLAPLAELRGLKSLHFGWTGVTDLAPLARLQELQELSLWSCEGVKDLAPVAQLQELRMLSFGYTGVTNLAPVARLIRLQILRLSGTDVTSLSPLAELQELQCLDLTFCKSVADLTPLRLLQRLQSLNLYYCETITNLTPLAGLRELQSLQLSSAGITDLTPLADLRGLQSLQLSSAGITDLTPLARLRELQSLQLSSTGITDLAPLAGLRGLQSLQLSSTGITDLTPLAGLWGLQSLQLSSTGITDLAPLAGLRGLKNLHLSDTGVTDLTPLAGLRSLKSLHLSSKGCITDLAPLAGLQRLRSLYLLSKGITDITPLAGLLELKWLSLLTTESIALPPLARLQGLQSLNLTHTSVTDLVPLVGLQGLQNLDLFGCRPAVPAEILRIFADHPRLTKLVADEAVGVPREILSLHLMDNCLPRLSTYFAELDLGAEAENEVKVILLGNGRVGKTQLCRRFRGQAFDESVPSTHGVQIWREELRFQTGGQEQVFQINWWDFGGQDIYHGTHALFLRSRAVFLILWTPQLENREEYSENEIPLRNQPLAYWLDYVRTLAGEGNPVIVVQSQCDRFEDRRSPPPRPVGFRFFEGCSYSAKTDLGRETLEAHLRDALRYLLERNGALEIGQGRAEVRRRFYEWRSEDQERTPEERRRRTLTPEEFRALCEEVGGILSWEHALDYFHHTGVVFYDSNLFSNCIVLDQDWALAAVYAVFHRGRAVPWLRDSGRFTREDLASLVWQEHSPEEQRLFLGLMESCGVCFPCGKTAQGETRYVAPDLLPGFETVKLPAWKEDPGTPTLRLEYRFFHPAVIRGLMSEIGRRAEDYAEYWKYGLWLKDGQRETQLLVQFENTSTNEAPGAGTLELKVQGGDPLGLLREIRRTILWRWFGEEPEELLTLDGITVTRGALDTVIDGRVLDLQKKLVPAAAFAAFFEDRKHDLAEGRAIDINPQPLTASEKPREVFISYAWGDETPEGRIRAQAVDGLQVALEKDGFLLVRDRDQMRPGDQISSFIRRLTRADLAVAVISDKYLRSPYCMFEIYKLWQKSQTDSDEMVERLVPIVLPDVKIGNIRERLPYLEYWADQAESLEALIRNPKLSPSSESWEEVRLVREFAHHVDGILVFLQDVLMPRKLEAHLDDGFQAVREALRRRMGVGTLS